jgi:DNA-binding response OmpR family regulator
MSLHSKIVILIEDDPIISWHLTSLLSQEGIDVEMVIESKEQALKIICKHPRHFIITNLRLFDGWLTQRDLERWAVKPSNLLILTGYNSENELSAYLNLNNVKCLYKPYSRHQLMTFLSYLRAS